MHRADRGLYLGVASSANAYSGASRSVLVLGPTRAGKTSALMIPNVLGFRGAVVTTSTKRDVLAATSTPRRRAGHVVMFDPSGTVDGAPGVRRVGWSPVAGASTWDGAVLTADAAVDAARLRARGAAAPDHWSERARTLLAPLLHAAALESLGMDAVARWVDARDGASALGSLCRALGPAHPAPASLGGLLRTEERELSGIWSTASGLLSAWRTDAAREAARAPALDLDGFVLGANTLHIVAPSRHQASTAPLIAGLLDAVVHATYRRHEQGARTLLALDELANVAPLPSLPSIVSEGAGQGVVVLGCLQDLSQARVRWGVAAEGFLSLFPTTVVLAGIADRTTLETISAIAGRHHRASSTVARGGRARRTTTTSLVERPRLGVDEIARGRGGAALVLDAQKRCWWVRLAFAHEDPRLGG